MDVYLLVAVATFLCVLLAVPTFLRFAGGGQSSSSSGSGQGKNFQLKLVYYFILSLLFLRTISSIGFKANFPPVGILFRFS